MRRSGHEQMEPGSTSPAVRVSGLTKSFSRGLRRTPVLALNAVDLEVATGEVFGLLGPNGAGKTTLLKILLGLVRPSAGQASLLGVPADSPRARARIGYLPENHRFPAFLTATQMLDIYGRLAGVDSASRRRRIPELLELVSMAKWADTRIRQFSKGMMQRVGIAQALMNDPEIVFLDEPTDGVDPVGRKDIRNIVVELRRQGKTIFLNSHLLSEIERVCTRVAIMNEGHVVRDGSVDALTQVESGYRITSTRVSDPARLGLVVPDAPNPDSSTFTYLAQNVGRDDLNGIVDQLRRDGVLIEAIEPVRQTLEDYFIEVVGREAKP